MDVTAKNYVYLKEHYTEEYMSDRYRHWYRQCRTLVRNIEDAYDLKGFARIDRPKLRLMIFSYFADIIRLKKFHTDINPDFPLG